MVAVPAQVLLSCIGLLFLPESASQVIFAFLVVSVYGVATLKVRLYGLAIHLPPPPPPPPLLPSYPGAAAAWDTVWPSDSSTSTYTYMYGLAPPPPLLPASPTR
jgi:hypothetical protein